MGAFNARHHASGLEVAMLLLAAAWATNVQAEEAGRRNEALQRVDRMLSIQKEFGDQHAPNGLSASQYVRSLQKEGFACRLQYRNKAVQGTGQHSHKVFTTVEPAVDCIRAPSGYAECLELRVATSIDWRNPRVPLKELTSQLNDSPVASAVFVCEVEPLTPGELRAVSEGFRRGYIVDLR